MLISKLLEKLQKNVRTKSYFKTFDGKMYFVHLQQCSSNWFTYNFCLCIFFYFFNHSEISIKFGVFLSYLKKMGGGEVF
jgi:hypothetical protein